MCVARYVRKGGACSVKPARPQSSSWNMPKQSAPTSGAPEPKVTGAEAGRELSFVDDGEDEEQS
eukprot:12990836-Alexandrium_andersonii.AAC.1